MAGRSGPYLDKDYATVMYDNDGNEQWVAHYDGPGECSDQGRQVVSDALGGIIVMGYECLGGYYPYYSYGCATIRYDTAGTEQWVYSTHGGCTDMVPDGSGNLYMTGLGFNPGDPDSREDYQTIKLDPEGNEVWVAYYNGPNPDYNSDASYAIDLDDDGNVYVTGYSMEDLSTSSDYLTVKYNPSLAPAWPATATVLSHRYPQRILQASDWANPLMVLLFAAGTLVFIALPKRAQRRRGKRTP